MKGRIFRFCKVLFITILCYVCGSANLVSQTYPYYHYSSSEGLASSSVYDIIQDRNGFIWFATANGVSKFDGHNFINYSTADGLNSSNIISMIEGPNGEIFFGNNEKGFNVYAGDRIENYSHQKEQNASMKGMFTSDDDLYSYSIDNITRVNSENTFNLYKGYMRDSLLLNKIVKLSDGTIVAGTTKGIYKFENDELNKIHITGFDDREITWLCGDNQNRIIAGARGKIFEIENNSIIRSFDIDFSGNNNILRLLKDSKGNIWFSIMNRGFYCIKTGTNRISDIGKNMGLSKSAVNSFIEDNEGNIWVSTYGDGVFCLNNLYLINYNQSDGLSNNKVLSIVKDDSDRIVIGTLDGLNVLENDSLFIINNDIGSRVDYMYIYRIKLIDDLVYVSGTYNNLNNFKIQTYKNDQLYLFNTSAFCKTEDNKFITGGWSNSIYTQPYPPKSVNGEATYLFNNTKFINKVYDIFEDSRNNLWIATTSGLCKITPGHKSFFPSNEILSTTIRSIVQDQKDRIWFAGDKGVVSYGLNDSAITNYPNLKEYNLTSSNVLSVDKLNRLWIGTMNGLFIFNKDTVRVLNTETGLPSSEILTLYCDTARNYMWVGSAKGLSSMDISEFENNKVPPVDVNIINVKAEDSVYTDSENYTFEPDKNNIHIDFVAINYSSPGSITYQYNINNEWVNVPDDYVNFSFLKKGDYKLAIRGKIINSPWGRSKIISFTVLPYFSETLLFRGSLTGLIIIGIAFVAYKRIKYTKDKSKEKLDIINQINELKHKALSSMMNPHFIFNSLNSVQYLINSDRKREANDYISLMARLIRMNLETASESYIKLDDEIKRLDLYLQIEKLRFSEKFNYEITTSKNVDPALIMIPNMIIQPFVENSIWHGIMPSGREGLIKLSFNFEDVTVNENTFKFFSIRITDNGIGLTEATKNKMDGHVSKGIQIIQDRLILLSKVKNLPQPIIGDLNKKNKSTQGTEVLLSIPPDLYKVISKPC